MHFDVSVFAGAGGVGQADGPKLTATFDHPDSIAVSPSGVVYVTEFLSNGIRKIEGDTVSTPGSRNRGTADGPWQTAALFDGPQGIACDHNGNLYVADQVNHRIRKIDVTGNVTTIAGPFGTSERLQGWADGPAGGCLFNYPLGIDVDGTGGIIYVSEYHRIRCVPLSRDGMVYTVAAVGIPGFADGPATLAQFNQPLDLKVTQTGDLFVADSVNLRIRRVSPSGMVTTVAGDGVPALPYDKPQFADDRPALNARFELVSGLAVDPTGIVWLADGTHVRMYSPFTNTVSTACSDKGHQHPIEFVYATGIAFWEGNILVVDGPVGAAPNQIIQLTPIPD